MAKKVKLIKSNQAGAPTFNGVPGSLISLLDTVLVTGFNSKTPIAVTVAGEIATVTLSAGHGFSLDDVVKLSGVTNLTGLNGEWDVTVSESGQIKFACPGVPDGTATGTIDVRIAPLGWEKQFGNSTIGCYRSTNALSSKPVLRVDNSNSTWTSAKVAMFDSMTDMNTGMNQIPSNVYLGANFSVWGVSSTANLATARFWRIIGDDRTFYIILDPSTYGSTSIVLTNGVMPYYFGEFKSFKPGDTWNHGIGFSTISTMTSTSWNQINLAPLPGYSTTSYTTSNTLIQRNYNGMISGAIANGKLAGEFASGTLGSSLGVMDIFTPAGGAISLHSVKIYESNSAGSSWLLRGEMRGPLIPIYSSTGSKIETILVGRNGDLSKKTYLIGTNHNAIGAIVLGFDITGTWE